LCVNPEELKNLPKLVGSAVLTPDPAILRKDTSASLVFTVSKELSQNPSVTLKVGGEERLMSIVETQSSGLNYTYSYTALGDEPSGADCAITIELTDRFGNRSGDISGGYIKFDFVSPDVSDVKVPSTPFKAGAVVTIEFNSTKVLSEDPVVTLDGTGAFAKSGTSVDMHYVYTYTVSGNEGEGEHEILADLTDSVGNKKTGISLGKITLDFTPPQIVADTFNVLPAAARKNGPPVSVRFTATKPLVVGSSTGTQVMIGGNPMNLRSLSGSEYIYDYLVGNDDTEGAKDIAITLVDMAGNSTGPVVFEKAVDFDFTLPYLVSSSVTPDSVRSGVAVVARFEADKPLSVKPTVKADGMNFTWVSGAPGEKTFEYTYTPDSSVGSDTAGVHSVTVDAKDEAGNDGSGLQIGTLTIDYSKPGLAAGALTFPAYATTGTTVKVSFSASKVLGSEPVVAAGTMGFNQTFKSGNDYVYAYTLIGTEPLGDAVVSINLIDSVGNESGSLPGGSFIVDRSKPNILAGSESISPQYVNIGREITVQFTSDKPLGKDPEVKLTGLPNGALVMNKVSQSGQTYTYNYIAKETDCPDEKQYPAGVAVKI
jgi:hypothetical protein